MKIEVIRRKEDGGQGRNLRPGGQAKPWGRCPPHPKAYQPKDPINLGRRLSRGVTRPPCRLMKPRL